MKTAQIAPTSRPPFVALVTARVLVIDDDEHFRALARSLLEPAGIELIEAVDARQGFTQIGKAGEIDAAIVDMVLPDRDGIQVLRQIRAMFPKVKIVAVSGAYSAGFYLDLSVMLGANAVLPKSQVERLLPLLENLLDPHS